MHEERGEWDLLSLTFFLTSGGWLVFVMIIWLDLCGESGGSWERCIMKRYVANFYWDYKIKCNASSALEEMQSFQRVEGKMVNNGAVMVMKLI